MYFKVENCCLYFELRTGCILIGIIGVVTALITLLVSILVDGGIIPILVIPLCCIGSVLLLFAAGTEKKSKYNWLNKITTTKGKRFAVLIYIGTSLLRVLLNCIGIFVVTTSSSYQKTTWMVVAVVESMISILLDMYFSLVAFCFYQEL